ncbi:DUF6879 family protein [Streptosporangium carneum]|uniref:DUF6879 domain-containing protein n=1 Tax=Streptosporangium carneum TaxID=47481 RepID=A0A9W6MEW3_9ACTN|nr:DUF6879 family protein [Streptosporangium carneum]GLK11621.1 hypothetical protein GCM10017600_50280 [Streptosporangium carneum]
MGLLTGDDFERLFATFTTSAFRLETRDRYREAKNESAPLRRFLAGEPDDMEWLRFWLDLVRDHNAHGRTIRRVRVVSHPFTDYTRFGLAVAEHNNAAGDHIRYLDRQEADRLGLPHYDWWLFDNRRLAFVHFSVDDVLRGAEIVTDPATVGQHGEWRDLAWEHSVSREEFLNSGA